MSVPTTSQPIQSNLHSDTWLRITSMLAATYLLIRATLELYENAPGTGNWLGRFSLTWGILFVLFCIFALLTLAGLGIALWKSGRARTMLASMVRLQMRLNHPPLVWLRWLLAALCVLLPGWFIYFTPWGSIFTGAYLRLLLLLFSSGLFALCLTCDERTPVRAEYMALGLVLAGSLHVVAGQLSEVVNYPFPLSWSEGNRLYDYSIYTDASRYHYQGKLDLPYNSPGRYWLWGIIYLLPNTPIWLHRLWDAILWTIPPILLGFTLTRSTTPQEKLVRWIFALWLFVFMLQGPIYTPLVLSALLVALFVRPKNWLLSIIVAAIAAYYASISRWTWVPACAAWTTILLLAESTVDLPGKGETWLNWLRRLFPISLAAILTLGAAFLGDSKLLSPARLVKSTALNQPRLWYRLLPSATNPNGILLELALAVGPLIILLFWLTLSKRWKLSRLQALAYLGACLAFLAIGLVASVKIGGGNNLHNLDMFLLTLVILAGLVFRQVPGSQIKPPSAWLQAVLALTLLIPSWNVIRTGEPLSLPAQSEVDSALDILAKKVAKAQKRGEVLFIDHRQLITFGYVEQVTLVSEYEKKYMMDQAMEGDAVYFAKFYEDLRAKRFELIVTEPIFTNQQDPSFRFQEENNAWVKWVAGPLLCYYAPVETIGDVRLQLLVPRDNPQGCP